ncbi:MAG: nuclear transport factor 2 family protein [Rhodospirillaceae bacterium]
MSSHPLCDVIAAADRAISAEDFDGLMAFYADDATLVVAPNLIATGKAQILKAFIGIAQHFGHRLTVSQRQMKVVESGDTALVLAETVLDTEDAEGLAVSILRRATYVFRKSPEGDWLCAVDNSYGTGLLGR